MSTKYSNKFTEQEWEQILTETNGIELKVVAERYGITVPCLKYQMKKRDFKHIPYRFRVNNLNENYFETIDSQEKSYFLGFLLADGCVAKSNNTLSKPDTLSVILNVKDIEILEFMKHQLNADNKITFSTTVSNYGTSNVCRLVIRSTKLCSDLINAGIIPRKTGQERIPELSNELMQHFIRGFFDGDGCITKSRGYATVGFTSCYECLNQLNDIFHNALDLNIKNIYKESGTKKAFRLYYGQSIEVNSLYKYLYENATIFLNRKKNKFDKLLNEQNSKSDHLNLLKDYNKTYQSNIIHLREINKISQREMSYNIGITPQRLCDIEKRSKIVNLEIANKIAEYFKLNINELIQEKIIAKKEGFDSNIIKSLAKN